MAKIFSLLILLILQTFAYADSLPMKNGHYTGGPFLTLKLNKKQTRLIKNEYSAYIEIGLSESQRKAILKESRIKESPTKLILATPTDIAQDCTCGLANFGLIVSSDTIEIPIEYLCSDKEAEDKKIVD